MEFNGHTFFPFHIGAFTLVTNVMLKDNRYMKATKFNCMTKSLLCCD